MTTAEELAERISVALEDGKLATGMLLPSDPEDRRADAPSWHMATRLRPDVLSTLRKLGSLARMKSELVGHPGRTPFWVVVYQAGAMQHRFLLPLIGPLVRNLIEDLPRHRLGLLMHSNLQEPFLEAHMRVPVNMCAALRQKHLASANVERAVIDVALMVGHVLHPSFVAPPASCLAPESLHVTSVLPPELMANAPVIQDATNVQ